MAQPSTGLWLKLDDTNTAIVDGVVPIKDSSQWNCDASISLWDGNEPNDVIWADGHCGSETGPGALDFDMTGNVITVTNLPDVLTNAKAMTITFWQYHDVPDLAGEANSAWDEGAWVEGLEGDHPDGWTLWAIDWDYGDCVRIWDEADDCMWCADGWSVDNYNEKWTHYAFVLSPEATMMYADGELLDTASPFGSQSGWQVEAGPGAYLSTIRIGRHSKWYDDEEHDGWIPLLQKVKLDDIRIYDNVLNQASIQSIMDCSQGSIDSFYVPLESIANIVPKVGDEGVYNPNNIDVVNFVDYAVLADSWLESSPPWPY